MSVVRDNAHSSNVRDSEHHTAEERYRWTWDTLDDSDPYPAAVRDPDGEWVKHADFERVCRERDLYAAQAKINAQTVIRQAHEIRRLEGVIARLEHKHSFVYTPAGSKYCETCQEVIP